MVFILGFIAALVVIWLFERIIYALAEAIKICLIGIALIVRACWRGLKLAYRGLDWAYNAWEDRKERRSA